VIGKMEAKSFGIRLIHQEDIMSYNEGIPAFNLDLLLYISLLSSRKLYFHFLHTFHYIGAWCLGCFFPKLFAKSP
jgi:hypothetical protein